MKKLTAIIILISLLHPLLFGQNPTINKEVRVIKAYKPNIEDADKMLVQPILGDTIKYKPQAAYYLQPRRERTSFEPRPIKPAKMVGVPLNKLYNTYLKAGVGNYFTPLAEISVNNLRNRQYSISAFARHKSSLGKVKLENNEKVHAGYANNNVEVSGKYFFNEITLGATLAAYSKTCYAYGYDTERFPSDVFSVPTKKDTRINYTNIQSSFYAHSTHADSNRINYYAEIQVGRFSNASNFPQNNIITSFNIERLIQNIYVGADIKSHAENVNDTLLRNTRYIGVTPWMSIRNPGWTFRLGMGLYSDRVSEKLHAFPNAHISFTIVEDVLYPYAGLNGGVSSNSYAMLAGRNPYITEGTAQGLTITKINAYAGVKGSLNSKAAFNLKASLKIDNNYAFFITDTASAYNARFTLDNQNNDLITNDYMAELQYFISNTLRISSRLSLYNYTVSNGPETAWHLPAYKLAINGFYNLHDKILFNTSVIGYGKREVYDVINDKALQLNPFLDINFKAEYVYSTLLSFFVQGHNLLAENYQLWQNYPVQRLQLIAGLKYNM